MTKKELADQVFEQCLEKDQQAYDEARIEFKKRVANPDAKPGVSRIKEIEGIWSNLNNKRKANASDAVHAMLKEVDEAEIIESKKVNSKKEG